MLVFAGLCAVNLNIQYNYIIKELLKNNKKHLIFFLM